jgi:hypothetical protein
MFSQTMAKMLKDKDILREVNRTEISDDNDYTGESDCEFLLLAE